MQIVTESNHEAIFPAGRFYANVEFNFFMRNHAANKTVV